MKIINLTEEQLELAKEIIGNEYTCKTDGCLCGNWEIKIKNDLWLTLHRSCRKANATPMGKQWNIHGGIYFYSTPVDERWDEDEEALGKLGRVQTKILRDIANKTTENECGYDINGEELSK